jgi:hypothetical protein
MIKLINNWNIWNFLKFKKIKNKNTNNIDNNIIAETSYKVVIKKVKINKISIKNGK